TDGRRLAGVAVGGVGVSGEAAASAVSPDRYRPVGGASGAVACAVVVAGPTASERGLNGKRSSSPLSLERINERSAPLAAPRHRDLVRAMRAEVEAIDDPAERRRFAAGAITAIVRLAVRRYGATNV